MKIFPLDLPYMMLVGSYKRHSPARRIYWKRTVSTMSSVSPTMKASCQKNMPYRIPLRVSMTFQSRPIGRIQNRIISHPCHARTMTMNHHPNHPIRSMRCKLAMIVLKIPKAVEIIVPSLEITIVVVTFYHFRIRHRPVWSIAVIVVVWFHRPPHPNVHPPRLCKYRMM